MSRNRTKKIGAYLNSRTGGVGKTVYGFIKREIKTRELPSGERQIIRKPKEDDVISTDKDGYFEFQDTPENRKYAYKLIMDTKSGTPMLELEDLELQDELIGEVIRLQEKDDYEQEGDIIEKDIDFTAKFKNKANPKQIAAAAKAREAKRIKAEAKKAAAE